MKLKQICIFCICLSVSFLYAETVWFFPTSTYCQWLNKYAEPSFSDRIGFGGPNSQLPVFPSFVCDDKYVYLVSSKESERLDRKAIHVERDLYQKVVVEESSCTIIEGGGYCTIVADFNREIREEFVLLRTDMLKGVFSPYTDKYSDLLDLAWIMPNAVKSVKMSVPFLTETVRGKQVTYDDDILKYRWFIYGSFSNPNVLAFFVNDSTPMVEGAAGNGTGLVLDIDFHIPSDNLVVLNGFVDTDRPHLYKMNARMKTVRVQGDGFDFEYTFKDYVHFAQIDFPKQVTNVKLTVTDVYDGEKWEDMAISGLWVNPDILKTANTDLAREYLKYAEEGMTERILYGWQIERDKKKQEERDRTKKQNVQE